jgi:hypothetical protein
VDAPARIVTDAPTGPLLAAELPDVGFGLAAAISCGVKFSLYKEYILPGTGAILKNKG